MKLPRIGVLLVGGVGQRMGGSVPKQYLELKGQPIFAWTLRHTLALNFFDELIIVSRPEDSDMLQAILAVHSIAIPCFHATSGTERSDSVRSALEAITHEHAHVYIHDGVRPFLTRSMVEALDHALQTHRGAIVAVSAKETVKVSTDSATVARTIPRATVYLAQTPQAFDLATLRGAMRSCASRTITDDASALEACGIPVALVAGTPYNIKITLPSDLPIAECIAQKWSPETGLQPTLAQ